MPYIPLFCCLLHIPPDDRHLGPLPVLNRHPLFLPILTQVQMLFYLLDLDNLQLGSFRLVFLVLELRLLVQIQVRKEHVEQEDFPFHAMEYKQSLVILPVLLSLLDSKLTSSMLPYNLHQFFRQ